MNNTEILKLENISLTYDKKTYIFKDISFSVNSGEILSIIGMNGAGKTTLLKVIAGILKPSSGKIIKNFKNLSYIPQKLNIDSTFPIKVTEFIKIYNKNTTDNEIRKYLKKLNGAGLLNKTISKLSGGEFQKVLIISGLLSKPDLLLLDEPTAGIDLVGEEKFYEIISEVKKVLPNLSVVIVSHNINLVYKNSDKILCLHENNLCCHSSSKDIQNYEELKNIFGKYLLPYEHKPHKKH